jgi:hypothetical protein
MMLDSGVQRTNSSTGSVVLMAANRLLVVVKLLKIQFSNFKEGLSILEYFISLFNSL